MRPTPEAAAARRLAARYNLLLNLFWSAPVLVPLTVYGYQNFTPALLLLFGAISSAPLFISNRLIDEMRWVRSPAFYRGLGVGLVQWLSQNGVWVGRLVRRKYPAYRAVQPGRRSVEALLRQTFWFEKFHWALLVFFALSTALAATRGDNGWAFLFVVLNVFYNGYPILLQHFIRTKLRWRPL